ncbi:TonB-dependent receptor [Herbaspirillum sp. alder98]|uniref:TonB-dependent receptor n=1 Tax=Herbaspirillum sp. alder98 TaxID=2913096 RepID=UPI001CD8B49F|nr:TonB-dependent receptor [Herbaspirillum sp. alder98]MCA1326803.1 TonB-dependent receptor [Herbaspirillum sp. alder98]
MKKTSMRHRRIAVPLLLCLTPAVHAQSTDALPQITVGAQSPAQLQNPVSVGSRLDLTPLENPASVSVLTRTQLEERGDASIVEAITRAPGYSSLGHPGNSGSSLSVRGFTDTTSVMRLYDGVRQYGGVGVSFPFDTWSVQRIEVLRGPASVIYGDGAIGGVVNVVPKKPTRGKIENEVEATVGSHNTRRLGLGSGGAINDMLSYRVDLSGDRSDGWVDRGNSNNLSFSGALRLDVNPDLFLQLSYAQGHQRPMRYFGTPLINGQQLPALREKNYNVADSAIDYRDRWAQLEAQWTPNSDTTLHTRFYQVNSNRYWRNAESYTYNASSGLIDRSDATEIRHDQTQTGNTTDATFKGRLFGLQNQVAVGFDISSSTFKHTNNTYSGSFSSVDPVSFDPGTYASPVAFIPRYRNKAQQYSLFAEDKLNLTDAWTVLAGLRYDHSNVSRNDLVNSANNFDQNFSNVGWRLGSVYAITPELSVYGQYAKAADPVSSMLFLTQANSQFDLSTGRQLEVGVKQVFWNKRGEWTVSVYDIRKNNLLTRDPSNPALRQQVGQQSSRGIEASLALELAERLRLDLNATLLRARFDNFSESVGGVAVSRSGNLPTNVPQRLANAWLSWDFVPSWTASAGLQYVGQRFADNANTLKLPAYTTTDLALRWKATAATTVTLRGNNVFDKRYFATAYYTDTQWLYGPGREVQLSVNHRF